VSLATYFHAIDSRPVCWTGAEAGDRSPGFAVDYYCASGLISSLVISVVVKLTFSLRRLRPAGAHAWPRVTPVRATYRDHDHDIGGAHRGHTVLPRRTFDDFASVSINL
jgi:hypothetical protein